MIDLTAAKIKAAQPEAGLRSGGFRFKSRYGSDAGKWALLRCLKQGIECPNTHLCINNCIMYVFIHTASCVTNQIVVSL